MKKLNFINGTKVELQNIYRCDGCGSAPCFMIVTFPPLVPDKSEHPADKKMLKKCLMDRKISADFFLQE